MQGHHPLALSPLALRPLLADCPTQAKGKYENRLLEKTDQCGETSGQRQGLPLALAVPRQRLLLRPCSHIPLLAKEKKYKPLKNKTARPPKAWDHEKQGLPLALAPFPVALAFADCPVAERTAVEHEHRHRQGIKEEDLSNKGTALRR